jgi:hypothetical protein
MPTDMNSIMRQRRKELEDLPAYEGPPSRSVSVEIETEPQTDTEESPAPSGMTVAAPGDESTGETFEYEPFPDSPGAWVVYPPGVPCDDTVYRVQMTQPAKESDFSKMQQALDDAGAASSEPAMLDEDDESGY